MKLRALQHAVSSEDDLEVDRFDLAVAPAASTFLWGMVGSDVWVPVGDFMPVTEAQARPEVPVEVSQEMSQPHAWAMSAWGNDAGVTESFDLPNPPDLASEPFWAETWGEPCVSLHSLPSLVAGQTVADLAQRDQAFQELYQQLDGERSPRPVLPPSDLFLVEVSGFAQDAYAGSVTLIGGTRQDGPDVSLLSANGWI